jgi:hypothetical protein
LPIINIGTRQQNRALHADIINVDYTTDGIANSFSDNRYPSRAPPKAISEKEIVLHIFESFKPIDLGN